MCRTKKGKLRWSGHVVCNDDTDWIKHYTCTVIEVDGVRQKEDVRRT